MRGLDAVQPRHLALLGFVLAALGYMACFRYDAFGLEEAGAHALALNWTIAQKIITPAAAFGFPDLRAVVLAPLNLHWAGSLPAAKVYTMLVLFAGVLLWHALLVRLIGAEAAMIASTLLVLSPMAVHAADSIGTGAFLLLAAAGLAHLRAKALASPRPVNAWVMLELLALTFAVSLHPAGLGIAAVHLWSFWPERKSARGRLLLAGGAIAVAFPLLVRMGWPGHEPWGVLLAAGAALLGPYADPNLRWGAGWPVLAAVMLLVLGQWRRLKTPSDFTALIAALVLGAFLPDAGFALLLWAALLALGFSALIRLNDAYGPPGLLGKRGLVLAAALLFAVWQVQVDKGYRAANRAGLLLGPDRVIAALAQVPDAGTEAFLPACQWPAKAMLALGQAVMPLPPRTDDVRVFEANTARINYLAFDPFAPKLMWLARLTASLADRWETVVLLDEGVVLKKRADSRKARGGGAATPQATSAGARSASPRGETAR